MSELIKSYTAKIGADTADFKKEIKKAGKDINQTEKDVRNLQKSLNLKFDEGKLNQALKKSEDVLKETNGVAEAVRQKLQLIAKSKGVDNKDYRDLESELIKLETKAEQARATIAKLNEMKTDKLRKEFAAAGEKIESVGKKMTVLSGVSAAALGAMIKSGSDALKYGDDIATLATKYDLSTTAIQRWAYIAMQSDVSNETLYKGINKVRAALGEQLNGTVNTATQALDALNINVKNFDSNEDAFAATIDALSKVKDNTLQAYYANQIFGERMSADIIPLLQAGAGAINEYAQEFEQVGYMSEDQVAKMGELDNQMNALKETFKQAYLEVGAELMPVLVELAEVGKEILLPVIKGITSAFAGMSDGNKKAVISILSIITVIGPLIVLIGKTVKGIGVLLPLIVKLGAFAQTTGGKIAMIGAALGLIFSLISNWGNMSGLQKLIGILGTLTAVALGTAIAMGAFHSAATLGLAVAGIVAGIAAVVASVNSAKKGIEIPEISDFKASDFNVSGGNYSVPDFDSSYDASTPNLNEIDKGTSGTSYSTENNYNDNITINVNVEANEFTSDEEFVNAVTKKLALKLQVRR